MTPPRLLSFAVDHADALDPAPTGLTLGFSRAISLTGQFGNLAPILNKSIEVRDQNGQAWPVQVSAYEEIDARVSYLFDGSLPAGHYIVELPEQGGLTDLAGLSPIADGQPSGPWDSSTCPRPSRAIPSITVRCFPTTPRSVFVSSRPYPRDNRPHTDSSSPCPDCTRSRKGRRASRPPSRSRVLAWTARSIRPARTILSSPPENTRSDSATSRHRVTPF